MKAVYFSPFIAFFVASCATAPQVELKPVSSYGNMMCPQLQAEYVSLLEHEKYLDDAQGESSIFTALNFIGGIAMGAGGILLNDGSQPTAEISAASTSMLEDANLNSAKADSYKAKKEEITKRKYKMTELMQVQECAIPSLPAQ